MAVSTWPAQSSGLSFSLESSYGQIQSDFPTTIEENGSRRSATGQVGTSDPKGSVSLTALS